MQSISFYPYNNLNIKSIIFDLGGVILDIDSRLTVDAFRQLGANNPESMFTNAEQVQLLNNFDCGLVTPQEFRDEVRRVLGLRVIDSQIDEAWNALLLSWDLNRLKLIDELRKEYRVFLLSNTSVIHSDLYNTQLIELTGGRNLKAFFEKVYYSYEVGLRKPSPAIFEMVINENNLVPSETLFIDDTLEHIKSAELLGLNTYHIKPSNGETILQLFKGMR